MLRASSRLARGRGSLFAFFVLACSSSESSTPHDPGDAGAEDSSHENAPRGDAADASLADATGNDKDVAMGTGGSPGATSGNTRRPPSTSGAAGARRPGRS